jgi:large subunit ribosomal protein L25
MEQIEIVAYKRQEMTAAGLRKMRMEGMVPGVVYGGKVNELFSVPAILLKDVVYSINPKLIDFNLEGKEYKCILKDVQFHPVSEMILHVDFFIVSENQHVTMNVPLNIIGVNNSIGIKSGGLLLQKLRSVNVCCNYKHVPDKIDVDISNLDAGQTLRIGDIINALSTDIIIKIDTKTPVVEIKAQKK